MNKKTWLYLLPFIIFVFVVFGEDIGKVKFALAVERLEVCQVVLFGVFGFNGLFDFDSLFRFNSLFCFGSLFFLFCGSQILWKILLADYNGSFLYLHL